MRMALNAAISRLEELQVGTKDFDCYIEYMEQYFITNNIPEANKVNYFSISYWSISVWTQAVT